MKSITQKSRRRQSYMSVVHYILALLLLLLLGNESDTTTAFVTTTTPTKTIRTIAEKWGSPSVMNMFTGIVEEMGAVVSLEERDDMTLWDGTKGKGTELTVQGKTVLEDAYLGCSICVSGVCLTATEFIDDDKFKVGLAPETLRRTYFSNFKSGDAVNLERASELGGRNSGHFVQGHVDGTGTIIEKWEDGDSLFIKVRPNDLEEDKQRMIQYIVPKGFIAIDGTSLTVVDVDNTEGNGWFTFMLVEYTQKKIIIPAKQVGDKVNLEVDVLGKYSETALAAVLPRLEALETKVTSLEKQVSKLKGGDGV